MLTKLEVKRQSVHILVGVVIVALIYLDVLNALVLFIIAISGFLVSFLSKKRHIPVISKLLKTLDRKKDLESFPGKGLVFYVLGSFFAVFLFEKNIAMAAVMILALGDSVSRLVGPYGYLKHPFHNEKFLEGVLAGAFAATLGAMFFVSWFEAVLASIVAMLIEGADLELNNFKIDDNLMIPVVAGGVIWAMRSFVYPYFF